MSGLANRRNRLWIRGTERPVLLAHHLHAGCRESSRYRWFRTTGLDRGADGGTWRSPGGSGAQGTASETSTVRQGRTCLVLSTPSPASAAGCLGGRVRERRSDKGRTGLRGTGYITRLSNLPSYATVSKSTLHEHLTVACRLCPKSEDSWSCQIWWSTWASTGPSTSSTKPSNGRRRGATWDVVRRRGIRAVVRL